MQDAFGGSFLLKLMMIFFIIYVAFIGIALNFAKIYRIKNNVINLLEQYEYDMSGSNVILASKLGEYLRSVPYGYSDPTEANYVEYCTSKAGDSKVDETMYKDYGVCIIQKGETNKHYYSVTVYYVINFPILDVINLPITASGETVVIG